MALLDPTGEIGPVGCVPGDGGEGTSMFGSPLGSSGGGWGGWGGCGGCGGWGGCGGSGGCCICEISRKLNEPARFGLPIGRSLLYAPPSWAARVAELVDALDLGSSIERCGGSSPSARTISRRARKSPVFGTGGP